MVTVKLVENRVYKREGIENVVSFSTEYSIEYTSDMMPSMMLAKKPIHELEPCWATASNLADAVASAAVELSISMATVRRKFNEIAFAVRASDAAGAPGCGRIWGFGGRCRTVQNLNRQPKSRAKHGGSLAFWSLDVSLGRVIQPSLV